jgi:hypothetical protein
MPTEDDFGIPIVTDATIEVIYLPTGGRYVFDRMGRNLSLEKPRVSLNHGTSPAWEVEWLARTVADTALRKAHNP